MGTIEKLILDVPIRVDDEKPIDPADGKLIIF
jgi:hypothetical protein